MSSAVLLLGVSEPFQRAFRQWALRYGHTALSLDGDDWHAPHSTHLALCVLQLTGDGDEDRAERLRALRKSLRGTPLVVLASDLGIDSVVRLMRSGVADVIETPAQAEDVAARAFVHALEPGEERKLEEVVGKSPPMQELRREISAVAPMRSTVLLTGETGTGKGLVANSIHSLSDCRELPLVHVDCAALSPTVIESELFGHERGSFTGAVASHTGRFELAGHGTVFLDEIGDLSSPLQAKLLRVLEDRQYERIGGTKTRTMTARVIAATSHDLRRAVQEGRFRADLFFRLNVFHLRLPPLRERLSDIPGLVRVSLDRLGNRLQVSLPTVADSFYERLMTYDWPGNVRELMNVLERILIDRRATVLESDALDGLLGDDPASLSWDSSELLAGAAGSEPESMGVNRPPLDRDQVAGELIASGGNIARAARRLGVPRSTLRYRIRQLGLSTLIPKD